MHKADDGSNDGALLYIDLAMYRTGAIYICGRALDLESMKPMSCNSRDGFTGCWTSTQGWKRCFILQKERKPARPDLIPIYCS